MRRLAFLLLLPSLAFAENEVKDNSFLLEEAYNQDPGVVQHITGAVMSRDRDSEDVRAFELKLTQEWPLWGERHQISWEIPWSGTLLEDETCCTGVDDFRVNYRYALLMEDPELPALTPRFTVILPTGNERTGHSTGEFGFGAGIPMSKEAGPFALHMNTAIEWTPAVSPNLPAGVRSREVDLVSLSLGGSAILIVHPRLQPMVEALSTWSDEVESTGLVTRTRETLISPGVRFGAPVGNGQLVLGAAAPIGVGKDSPPWSALLYVSFEHAFKK